MAKVRWLGEGTNTYDTGRHAYTFQGGIAMEIKDEIDLAYFRKRSDIFEVKGKVEQIIEKIKPKPNPKPKKMTESDIFKLSERQQKDIILARGIPNVPTLEKDRVKLILDIQKEE